MASVLKFWAILLFVRASRSLGGRVEIRRIGQFVSTSHLVRQNVSSKWSLEDLEEFDLNESSLRANLTRTTQSTSDHSVVTEILPMSPVSETSFAHTASFQGEPQIVLQSGLHTVWSTLGTSLTKGFSALVELIPTADAGLFRFVRSLPKGLVSSLPKGFSALSELSSVAYFNGSDFSLKPDKGTKAEAREKFFQVAGIIPGDACKTSGFFKGRGCAIGCSCPLFQYCETKENAPDLINVGVCSQSRALLLLAICLFMCTCCICSNALSAEAAQEQFKELDSNYEVTPGRNTSSFSSSFVKASFRKSSHSEDSSGGEAGSFSRFAKMFHRRGTDGHT